MSYEWADSSGARLLVEDGSILVTNDQTCTFEPHEDYGIAFIPRKPAELEAFMRAVLAAAGCVVETWDDYGPVRNEFKVVKRGE